MASMTLFAGLGFAASFLLEYGWHAWIGHARRRLHASRDSHREHHRTVSAVVYPWQEMQQNLGNVAMSSAVTGGVMWWVVGATQAFGATLGLVLGYVFTTLYHAQMHRRAPATKYEEWMWRFHFHHHYGNPDVNFGLTNPLFDFVFRTAVVPETVEVPWRAKPQWLHRSSHGFTLIGAPRES